MYEDVGFDLTEHPFEVVAQRWHEIYRIKSEAAGLHLDALGVLESFSQRGSRQMVLSALPQTLLQEVVVSHGIHGFFEHVRGVSDLLAHSKVEVGKLLLQELGVVGSDVLMILKTAVAGSQMAHLVKIAAAFEIPVLTLTVPGLRAENFKILCAFNQLHHLGPP